MDELEVVGAGLPRTGTLSLRAALELLLEGPCYHGAIPLVEEPGHQASWRAAFDQESLAPVLAARLLNGYKAGMDHPFMIWYREVLALRPGARVVLTVREPRRWYASISRLFHIFTTLTTCRPYTWFLQLAGLGDGLRYIRANHQDQAGLTGRLNRAVAAGEEAAVAFYQQHTAEVTRAVAPSQLLVFDVSEGWEPLCRFLGRPVPLVPFPRVNDTQRVIAIYNIIRALAWADLLIVAGLVVLVTTTSSYHWTFTLPGSALAAALLKLGLGELIKKIVKTHTKQKAA